MPLMSYLCDRVTATNERARLRRMGNARWESPLWWFVRQAKAHKDLIRLEAEGAFSRIEKVLVKWKDPRTGKPAPDPWRCWLGVGREDAEVEFLATWEKIRYLPGATPLCNAIFEADRVPLPLDPAIASRRSRGYTRFVSLAGYLQAMMGARAIYLPSRGVAKVLSSGDGNSVSHATVVQYVKWAVEDDYLRLLEAHTSKQAARYVFAVERFQVLRERADPEVSRVWAATPQRQK